jgi:hypothetical protein
MAGSTTQYPKQILIGNTMIANNIKGTTANELTLKSSDNVVEVVVDVEASGGITLNAANVTLPQQVSYNPVKTNGDGKITA